MANEVHVGKVAGELSVSARQVAATAELLAGGATVPFIARYRKEVTAGLDEVAILAIRDRLEQLGELDKRRDTVLKSLQDQGKLDDGLKAKVNACETLSALEDVYLPYRPKRRTRAMIAREKGLEPLALSLLAQGQFDPAQEAGKFVDPAKGVADVPEALAGARDIIAEIINEDADTRQHMRELFESSAVFVAKVIPGKDADGIKYKDYFDWHEPAANAPSHRILAMRRGEAEGFLSLTIRPEEADAVGLLKRLHVKGTTPASREVATAAQDCYSRLLGPSMETEIRLSTRQRADTEAIHVFAANIRELLLASPLGQKNTLALDPGFRTGCKLACLDRTGKLLFHSVIYPHEPQNQKSEAGAVVMALCQRFDIEAVSIGNGTAGRETEAFIRSLELPTKPVVVMVNESGASVYSASQAAREEFPDLDLTVRGAVSIGRRLMDPLAELVKIEPKSIGVGQYQHDVDQTQLQKSLDDTVVSCVNAVGVEINTASRQLLSYVSGLGPTLADNLVSYRDQNGQFRSRNELRKVPRLGPKAFEQAAGFLRIRDGENPLDASAVHPESYAIVDRMAADVGCAVAELVRDPEKRQKINPAKYVTDTVGLPTLNDIIAELAKPGRDPRKQFEAFSFAAGVHEMKDLQAGMRLPGIVTNVAAFGAFVDVGVHQDGLVHVSQLADRFVKDPAEVVKVGQKVSVTVLEVDLERKRISLSMRAKSDAQGTPRAGLAADGTSAHRTSPQRNTGDSKGATANRNNAAPKNAERPSQGAKPSDRDRRTRADQPLNNNPFADFFKNHKPTK